MVSKKIFCSSLKYGELPYSHLVLIWSRETDAAGKKQRHFKNKQTGQRICEQADLLVHFEMLIVITLYTLFNVQYDFVYFRSLVMLLPALFTKVRPILCTVN